MWSLTTVDWSQLRTESGTADRVPGAIRRMVLAKSADDARAAHDMIEGEVFCQNAVYESALPTVRGLLQGLLVCTESARPFIVELLYLICTGDPGAGEAPDLVARCRDLVARSLPLFWHILETDNGASIDACVGVFVAVRREIADHQQYTQNCFVQLLGREFPDAIRESIERSVHANDLLPTDIFLAATRNRPR